MKEVKDEIIEELLEEIGQRLGGISSTIPRGGNLSDEPMRKKGILHRVEENFLADADDTARAWNATLHRLEAVRRREASRVPLRVYLMRHALGVVAAALAAVALVFALNRRPAPPVSRADMTLALPSDYSRMTLTDNAGRVIELGDRGTVVIDAHGVAAEWKDGLLTFRAEAPQAEYYRVTVPCGKNMRVALADGSAVHLNAMTTMRFPTGFGVKRRVEMQGQAFFEVAGRNGQPFFVETDIVRVRVTGTRFDVSAYPDDPDVKVTLVEGAVEVNAGDWPAVSLAPSEQIGYTIRNGQLSLSRVDTDIFTGWTEGVLVFEDRTLREIMTSLARYYDIDPVFADEAAGRVTFGFKLPRYPRIDPIIDFLKQIAQVDITCSGRQVVIKSK